MVKYKFLIFLVLASLFCGYQPCEASEEEAYAGFKKLTSTVSGTVLFWGWVGEGGYDANYDESELNEKKKEQCVNNGLKVMAEEFDEADSSESRCYFSETLARYYLLKKDTKKYLFWSFKAAENGSCSCMRVLAAAYGKGDGVIKDLEESIKWAYLGAASGDEYSKQWVKKHGYYEYIHDDQLSPIFKEARKRAKDWMDAHWELFFTSN